MLTQNVTMVSGDSKVLDVTVTLPDDTIVNLTGATIRWVLAEKRTAATTILTKTTANAAEVLITAPTLGQFKVMIVPADTTSKRGVYWHECQITDADGNVSTVFGGKFSIVDDVA